MTNSFTVNYLQKSGKLIAQGFILFIFSVLIASCSVYDKLPQNEKLYAGAEVILNADSIISKETVGIIQSQLELLPKPAVNASAFGYPYRVGFYYLFNTNKTKGLKHYLRERLGQKPIFISPSIVNRNEKILSDFLNAEGFFRPMVSGKLVPAKKEKEAKAIYTVTLPKRYVLDTINYKANPNTVISGQLISDFWATWQSSILKKGQPYRFENIKNEHTRIGRQLRSEGYYYFRPEFVKIKADTTVGQQRTNLFYQLGEDIPSRSQKQFLINDIYVFSSNKIGDLSADSVDYDADFFRGIILADSSKSFKQRVFTDAIGFRPGNFYSTDKDEVTMQRLINLNTFQLVKSRFEVVNRLDSSLLNVYYYLSPKQRKSARAELNGITRSSGFTGSQFSLNWLNRNTFRGAEELSISANAGLEFQAGGKNTIDKQFRSNYRLAFEGKLTFPRFVMPFFYLDPEESKILPKTTINASYQSIIQRGLYNLNSISASLNYVWRQGAAHEHVLTPLTLSLVRATNISEAFIEEIFLDPRLLSILDNQLIPGGAYSYTFTPAIPASKKYSYTFTGNLDFAGNLVGLFDKLRKNSEKEGTLFGERYSQYFRFDGDLRYYYTLSPKLKWANRLFTGVGIPYGNSVSLPYTRQYFSGGNNSIRAFRARGIGPGAYQRLGSITEQFLGNFTGDVKLELNTELRQKLNDFIGLVAFIDAGNIWMYKDAYIYEDREVIFGKNFYKQIGIGTGIGFRFDFSFFVFRIDLATPVRRPSRPEGERWVFNEIDLRDPSWRKQNLVFNFAVGYPF